MDEQSIGKPTTIAKRELEALKAFGLPRGLDQEVRFKPAGYAPCAHASSPRTGEPRWSYGNKRWICCRP
jgi:hypothetical protein